MSQTATGTGKNYDLAVEDALKELGATHEQIDTIKVIQQAESGVFGLFGKKDAIVEVSLIEPEPEIVEEPEEEVLTVVGETDKARKAILFLNEVFNTMGLTCDIDAKESDGFLKINLKGDRMGILIGRRGQTLDSLQYLTSLAVNKEGDGYTRIILDTENYREKRQKTLEDLAKKMADKAVRFNRRIKLEPMNPAERRIIHATLQNDRRVHTYSEGEDPYRRIVIQAH